MLYWRLIEVRCTWGLHLRTSRDGCDLGEEASLPSDSTALAIRMTESSELTDDAKSADRRRGVGHLTDFVTGMQAGLPCLAFNWGQLS